MKTARACASYLSGTCALLVLLTFSGPAGAANAVPVSPDDPDITDQAERRFLYDPAVPFNSVNVETRRGIVTLSGSVRSLLAKQRATRLAETVGGVRAVVNRLQVEPLVQRSTAELKQAVEDALF